MTKRKNETIEEFKARKKVYDQQRNKSLTGGWSCFSPEYYENQRNIENLHKSVKTMLEGV